MKAVLINAKDQTVTDVEYDGNWKSISKLIDCNLFAVAPGCPDGDDLYVDEEGLLTVNEDSVWFQVPWFPEPLVGSGLILGLNRETGESEDCNHNADFYRDQVRFLKTI